MELLPLHFFTIASVGFLRFCQVSLQLHCADLRDAAVPWIRVSRCGGHTNFVGLFLRVHASSYVFPSRLNSDV